MHGATRDAVTVDEWLPRSGLRVDLATGPGCGTAGLRRLIAALADAGADFGSVPDRYPVEWSRLTEPGPGNAGALAGLALSASERRLHRESEQVFRVLAVAAAAICQGAESLAEPVALLGIGRTDLPSLRGLVRVAEYGAATGLGQLHIDPADAELTIASTYPAADTSLERARCLRGLGMDVAPHDLRPLSIRAGDLRLSGADPAEAAAFATATGDAGPVDRLAAALAYGRMAFYGANWEGLAVVASACLPLATRLTVADLGRISEVVAAGLDETEQAIEFEPALLRHPGDVHAYLLKLLGIQASFRGYHDEALEYFRAMRDSSGPRSVETVAQSHLYSALTLAKRQHRLPEAEAELDAGLSAVAARPDEESSVRRERGWLHNLRGLVLFRRSRYADALEQERAALDCVEGAGDASAVHLRVNLVSNISVLQESAGKFGQALLTWDRFRTVGGPADGTFVKHHAYRGGGLRVAAGDVQGGVPALAEAMECCIRAADDFHEYEIAAELGTLMLGRKERTAAGGYFEQAGRAAARLGDPYRMTVAAVGAAAAAGAPIGERIAAPARASRTQAALAADLIAGCRDGADVMSLLPGPRTKLNRPFDLINV